MKIGFRKIGLIAATAGLMIAGSAYANGAKGGGLDLVELSGKRAVITETATAKVTECSKCTTETKLLTVRENKARVVREVPTTVHGCPACSSTASVVGHGKAKMEKRVHTCTEAPAKLACCAK